MILFVCGLIVMLLFLIRIFVFVVQVVGKSMEPSFQDGDWVLALRYWPDCWLHRKQIVIWELPLKYNLDFETQVSQKRFYIKRITGLSGELITSRVVAASSFQDKAEIVTGKDTSCVWHIPPDHCFVEGDSRGYDSTVIGPIPTSFIRGIVLFRFRRKAVVTAMDQAQSQ